MRYIHGIKIGGLQQKIFNLMLIFIALLVAVYAAVGVTQQKHLSKTVEEASAEQQDSIRAVSEATMETSVSASMTKTTALQAYIADDLFSDVRTDVLTLRSFASQLFGHADSVSLHESFPPDKNNDGKPSVQMQHEPGVDPAASRPLGIAANMSETMLSMFESTDRLSSLFVATPDGCILFVDDRAGSYFDENGNVYDFDVRGRSWYRQAVQSGKLIFTGVESDAFTGIAGLVCAAPVYVDGELAAVVGADIFLTSIDEYVRTTASYGGFICVINENGQVLFSPNTEGIFKPELAENAPDLRKNENAGLAEFVTSALSGRTGLKTVSVDGTEYYMAGAPMPAVSIRMEPGESIYTQSGGMAWMQDGISMETNMKGGFGKALGRMFSGESLFMATYTAQRPAEITLAASMPGEIHAVEVRPGMEYVAQKNAFLCATPGVQLSARVNNVRSGLFGGEGFVLQQLSGQGLAFLELDGTIVEYDLAPGERLIVDSGNVAYFEASVNYNAEMVKGFKNVLFGGEGLFLTTLTGPGRVWLQTLTASELAGRLIPYIPTSSS